MRPNGFSFSKNIWIWSDFGCAFAQFVKIPASEAFLVNCNWSVEELATIPCAHGTAQNMIHRAGVREGMRVLVAGASGGVGSAAVQPAKRRGADVVGITTPAKMDDVRAQGVTLLQFQGIPQARGQKLTSVGRERKQRT